MESQKSLKFPLCHQSWELEDRESLWKTGNGTREKRQDSPWNSRSRRFPWKTEEEELLQLRDETLGKRELKLPRNS